MSHVALRGQSLPKLCDTLYTYCRQRVFLKQHGRLSVDTSQSRAISNFPKVKLSKVSDRLKNNHVRVVLSSSSQTSCDIISSCKWFCSQSTKPVEEEHNGNQQLELRYLFVTCCEDMWEDAPNGLKFDVGYADSHPGDPYNISVPVVVGVHGAPGCHKDLQPLLEPLIAKGCRVILPNLPGYGYTRGKDFTHDDCFTHSPEENSSLLAGLLTVLGIPKVDLMVGHSAGCYTVLDLCSEYKGVKSSMLINPGVHKPYRGIQPHWFLKYLTRCWDIPLLRPIIKSLVFLGGIPRGYLKIPPTHLMNSIRATINVDYNNVIHNVITLKEADFLSCVVISDNDRRIAVRQFEEFIELMGVSKDDLNTYTSDTPAQHPDVSRYPKGLMLKGGGHYPINRYPQVLMAELQKLLHTIR